MRMNYSRFLSVLLAMTLLFSAFAPFEVFAKDEIQNCELSYEEYYYSHNLAVARMMIGEEKTEIVWPQNHLSDGSASGEFSQTAFEVVLNGMIAGKSNIDVSSYGLYQDNIDLFLAMLEKKYPIEFIASDFYYYSYSYYTNSGKITKLNPRYRYDVTQRNYEQRYNDLVNITNRIIAKSDITDEFTATSDFHDYFVLNFRYDMTYSIYDAYTLLTTGTGVCQAYADAFRLLCNLVDVPCITVTSDGMNHAWNMVNIEGDWYHMDVTWDDPVPDAPGRNRRTYMYHSDISFELNCEHYGWVSDVTADSEKFVNMPRKSGYQQFFVNNQWYYIDGKSINTCDRYGNNISTLLNDLSSDSIGYYKGLLAYSSGKSIYTYNLSSGKIKCVYTMVPEESGDWANHESVRVKDISISESGLVTYTCYVWKKNPDKQGSYLSSTIDGVNTVQLVADEKIENVSLYKPELTLEIGGQEELNVLITPNGYEPESITWTTSDAGVAEVNGGIVTAVGEGTAVITVNVDGVTASCDVYVNKEPLLDACVFKIGDKNVYFVTYDAAFQIDIPCQMVNGVTYVPIRAVSLAANAKSVKYKAETREITITNHQGEIFNLTMDSRELNFTDSIGNEYNAQLMAAPMMIGNSACLPIRDTTVITNSCVKYVENSEGRYVVVSVDPFLSDSDIQKSIELYNAKI